MPRTGGSQILPIATTDVPILRLGVDLLPEACRQCGSGLLDRHPPEGQDRYWLIYCVACGTQLARGISPPPAGTIRDRADRVDGCSGLCRQTRFGMSHDPAAHEDYGRHLLLSDLRARPWVYGIPIPPAYLEAAREDGSARLRLDLRNRCLELDDGSVVVPSASEWAILLCLARRAGEVVEYLDLVEWIWGTRERRYAMADHRGRTSALNQLRQLTYRVRARLGHTAEDSIIVLVPGVGYRLGGRP